MTRRRTLFLLLMVVVGVVVAAVVLVASRDTSDRPRELDMTAVPPCELISKADLRRLNTTHLGDRVDLNSEFGEEGPDCRFFARDGATIDLGVVTNHGVDRWTDGDGGRGRTAEDVARIERFRVIRVATRIEREIDPDEDCRIYVDVADDQSLKVFVHGVEPGSASACDVAHRAAEAAMRTLIDRAGPAEH